RGDPQNGWDTDQFPADLQETTLVLYRLLQAGGLETGGFNFDAKVRRQSIDAVDMLHGHVGGLDLLARALLNAEQMVLDGQLAAFVADRYSGWNSTFGADILSGKLSLSALADAAATGPAPQPVSGRQEMLENLVQRFV
ncbi:MAG: xylose isomerase, partial [Elstera sp.]